MGLDIKTLAAAKKVISNTKIDLTESSITSALGYTPVNSNKIGSAEGVASLDANGKIPTSQLPSYVSDVIEVNGIDNASKTGESDKIYVDTVTNKTYRWSGTTYVEISASDIVTSSETNGNIKVNGSEISVYTHPSGTNPHGTTKDDVGLGNVPNVSTDDQAPTFTEVEAITQLTSGEKLSVSLGKISKAISDLISHIEDKSNPHNVSKSQIGLNNVENKSSANIRGELTKSNITSALGYTPPQPIKVLYDYLYEENLVNYEHEPYSVSTSNNGKFDYYILQFNNGIMIISIYMVRPNYNSNPNSYSYDFILPISFINNRYHVTFSPQGKAYDESALYHPNISQGCKTKSSFRVDTSCTSARHSEYMETMEGVSAICIGRWK